MQNDFQFLVGYYDRLHPEPAINFQMNRWINYLGAGVLEDMQNIAPRLVDFPSYRREFLTLAKKSLNDGKKMDAAYYFRSAEFFMRRDDPEKLPARNQFLQLLREKYEITDRNKFAIPYKDGSTSGILPAYYFFHDQPKGTIVIHGGFDSYIEEFFPLIFYLHNRGYKVICFEGPGQGGALLDSSLFLTHEWHIPVKAVFDYFKLEDVTLLGISMGGCLALRAAAYEPRVKLVIAYDVFYDWLDTTMQKLKPVSGIIKFLLDHKAQWMFNKIIDLIMKKSPLFDWGMQQAMLVFGVSTNYQVFQKSRFYTTRDISTMVKQDVLLMAGAEDHIIPIRHYYKQIAALKNVRSKTARLFTRTEYAQNHCQIGNLRLAIDYMIDWIELTSRSSTLQQKG